MAFDDMETGRLTDAIRLFVQRNPDMKWYKDRVDEKIADDYKSYVASEMWLDLICERLMNSYYRTQGHLWHDIDQIAAASAIYNGEEDDLTDNARQLTTKLKRELRQYVNTTSSPDLTRNRNKMNINTRTDKNQPGADGLGFQLNGGKSSKPSLAQFQEAQQNSMIQLSQDQSNNTKQ